jgi:tetratricopeptide (TPR) repeat protein
VVGLALLSVTLGALAWWAMRERGRAETQQALANQRLTDAREVANRIVFLLERRLQTVAGAAEVRRELLAAAEDLLKRLGKGAGDDPDTLRSRAAFHTSRGDLALGYEDLRGARSHYQQALAIAQRLAQADPSNTQWQRDLAVSHSRLGDLAVQTGNLQAAHEAYQQDLAIAQRLAQADPSNTEWQRDLSVSHNKLGDLAV